MSFRLSLVDEIVQLKSVGLEVTVVEHGLFVAHLFNNSISHLVANKKDFAKKIRPSFLGRIILFYKVSNYLLSLIAA